MRHSLSASGLRIAQRHRVLILPAICRLLPMIAADGRCGRMVDGVC
jgi:hypothetical protein